MFAVSVMFHDVLFASRNTQVKLLCAVTRVEDGAFDGCPQIERGLTVEEAKRIGIPGLRR